MNRDKYRKSWLRAHKSYERLFYRMLRKYFKSEAKKIPFDLLTIDNYKKTIDVSIKQRGLFKAYYDAYLQIGLIHGKRIGKGINRDMKAFNGVLFESEFQRTLYNWILENVGSRIISVRQEYVEYIQSIIFQGIKDGNGFSQMATELEKLINSRSFYRWQAFRIARTETTAAANRAALVAGSSSGVVLEKIWISALDNRTRTIPKDRFDHRVMNGVKVGQNEYFNVQGELLEYPAAPIKKDGTPSSAGNVIQCRCTTALIPKRDSNGRLMFT